MPRPAEHSAAVSNEVGTTGALQRPVVSVVDLEDMLLAKVRPYSFDDVMALLSVSENTLRSMIKRGQIRMVKRPGVGWVTNFQELQRAADRLWDASFRDTRQK